MEVTIEFVHCARSTVVCLEGWLVIMSRANMSCKFSSVNLQALVMLTSKVFGWGTCEVEPIYKGICYALVRGK